MIGHNNGPPIGDVSDAPGVARRYYWRKAHAAAWRTPPTEIVRLRSRAAEKVGLSYRDYTSILLDRGRRPSAVVFTLRTLIRFRKNTKAEVVLMPGVEKKLQRLAGNCLILVIARSDASEQTVAALQRVNELCGGCIAAYQVVPNDIDTASLGRAACTLLAQHGLPASQALFVGDNADDEISATVAGAARFLWAWHYFGESIAGTA